MKGGGRVCGWGGGGGGVVGVLEGGLGGLFGGGFGGGWLIDVCCYGGSGKIDN